MRQVLRNFEGEGRGVALLAIGLTLALAVGCGGGGGGGGGGTIGASTSGISPNTSGTPANLVAIDIFPQGDIAIFGSSAGAAALPHQQIIVVGYYKDGATRDLTRTVTYQVADAKVASLSGDGLVTPTPAGGMTTLTVSQKGMGGATLTVTRNIKVDLTKVAGMPNVQATSLELYPGPVARLTDVNPAAGNDQYQQFVTIVRYADGTCQDLSRNLGLSVQDSMSQGPSVAAAVANGGLLRGTQNATVDVIADYSVANLVASSRVVLGTGGAGAGSSGNGITAFTGGPLTGSTNPFDVVVLAALKAQKITPANLSTDGEFIRRATSDLAGRLPTEAEYKAFVADTTTTKRATLIDTLLASPDFAMHWANDVVGAWAQIGITAPGTMANQTAFDTELQKEIAADTPLNMMVANMATGTGPLGTAFDLQFPMAYQKNDVLMNTWTGMTSKCARCHDHPLTTAQDTPPWIQDQNYALYAFFAMTATDATKLNKAAQNFGTPLDPAWVFDPTQNAALPKLFVAGSTTTLTPIATRRAAYANLLPNSTQFARGTGHRIWSEIMDPLLNPNQFLQANLAAVANPALLAQIQQTFIDQKGSLKGFLRTVMNSKTYQLSTAGKNTLGDSLNARRTVRRQHSEVLESGLFAMAGIPYTAANITTLDPALGTGMPSFFQFNFGYPYTRALITERTDSVNMGQAFTLMNSTHAQDGLVVMPASSIMTMATAVDNKTIQLSDAITTIFHTSLSRDPTAAEMTAFVNERAGAATTAIFLQDAAVAVTSSIEYVMR